MSEAVVEEKVDSHVKKKEEQVARRCPECGSEHLVRDYVRGDLICTNCGLVVSEREIDTGPEWRAFTPEEQAVRSRAGAPLSILMHDRGLSTMIDAGGKDAHGKELSPETRYQAYTLRKWQMRARVHTSIERNLTYAMAELDRISSQLGIGKSIRERAALLYRQAIESGLVRGRSIDAVIAAAVYAACRMRHIPLTLDEIAKYTRVKKRDIARCYRLLLRALKIKMPLPDPLDFIPRIAERIRLKPETQKLAIEIIRKARKIGYTAGKDPAGVAAAAVYLATLMVGERHTQSVVAEAADVTEVTVRNRYKELQRKLGIKVKVRRGRRKRSEL